MPAATFPEPPWRLKCGKKAEHDLLPAARCPRSWSPTPPASNISPHPVIPNVPTGCAPSSAPSKPKNLQSLARELAPTAPFEIIALCHPMDYIEQLRDATPSQGMVRSTPTPRCRLAASKRRCARSAAPCTRSTRSWPKKPQTPSSPRARRATMPRPHGRWAFACSTMPPSRRAMRRDRHGITRAAIVDFDVHHGNGSQEIFWSDKTVMYCSTHQMPLFPGTGAVGERGEHNTIVNAPLRPGDDAEAFRAAFESACCRGCANFVPNSSSSPPASTPTCATRSPTSISTSAISPGRRESHGRRRPIRRRPHRIAARGRLRSPGAR